MIRVNTRERSSEKQEDRTENRWVLQVSDRDANTLLNVNKKKKNKSKQKCMTRKKKARLGKWHKHTRRNCHESERERGEKSSLRNRQVSELTRLSRSVRAKFSLKRNSLSKCQHSLGQWGCAQHKICSQEI